MLNQTCTSKLALKFPVTETSVNTKRLQYAEPCVSKSRFSGHPFTDIKKLLLFPLPFIDFLFLPSLIPRLFIEYYFALKFAFFSATTESEHPRSVAIEPM